MRLQGETIIENTSKGDRAAKIEGRSMRDTVSPAVARLKVVPMLVYWHCNTWWPLGHGPECPMVHDDRPRRGRKRRGWICYDCEGGILYLSRKGFLEHDEESCYAS